MFSIVSFMTLENVPWYSGVAKTTPVASLIQD